MFYHKSDTQGKKRVNLDMIPSFAGKLIFYAAIVNNTVNANFIHSSPEI